jgi:hypothetical protein
MICAQSYLAVLRVCKARAHMQNVRSKLALVEHLRGSMTALCLVLLIVSIACRLVECEYVQCFTLAKQLFFWHSGSCESSCVLVLHVGQSSMAYIWRQTRCWTDTACHANCQYKHTAIPSIKALQYCTAQAACTLVISQYELALH